MTNVSFASPFLISNANQVAIGGKYEIRETTPVDSDGVLVSTIHSEQDGSMRFDVSSLSVGIHTYKIIYIVWNIPSASIYCTLTVTAIESKNITKKISRYSITKTWLLTVPASSVTTVKMAN
jgi:hypothetical protein